MKDVPVVHVYEHYSDHCDVIILGNRKGLLALYDAIGNALTTMDGKGTTEVYVNDGEGYDLEIQVVDEKEIDNLPVPYTAAHAKERSNKSPYDFLKG